MEENEFQNVLIRNVTRLVTRNVRLKKDEPVYQGLSDPLVLLVETVALVLRVKWANQEILVMSVTKDQKAVMVMLVVMVNGVYLDILVKTAFLVRLEVLVKMEIAETKEQKATMAVLAPLGYLECLVNQECVDQRGKKANL